MDKTTGNDSNALINRLWLEPIYEKWRQEAAEQLLAGDWDGCAVLMSDIRRLGFVYRNRAVLQGLGLYEKALVEAYVWISANYSGWPLETLEMMFAWADPQRLRAAGNPLPGVGPFTVYRGVAGHGRGRRVRGLSWTGLPEVAWRFAKRFKSLANPAVYRTVVQDKDVLAYTNDRKEQEFIILPSKKMKPVRILPDDVEPRPVESIAGEGIATELHLP